MRACDGGRGGGGGARWMAAILVSCVKQYFCSSSTAKFTSPTVLLFKTSTIVLHAGEEKVFSHVVRVSLRQSEVV